MIKTVNKCTVYCEVVSVTGQKRAGKVVAMSGPKLLLGWWILDGHSDLWLERRKNEHCRSEGKQRDWLSRCLS